MPIGLTIIRIGTSGPNLIHTLLTAWQPVNQGLVSKASA